MKITASLSAGFLLLCLLGGLWIYLTESGLNWGWKLIEPQLPRTLKIQKIRGSLRDKIHIGELLYRTEDFRLQGQGVQLDCDWLNLLSKKLICNELTFEQLDISQRKKDTPKDMNNLFADLPEFQLPLQLKVKKFQINQISYKEIDTKKSLSSIDPPDVMMTEDNPDETSQLNHLEIKNFIGQEALFHFDLLSLAYQKYSLQLSGWFATEKQWSHDLTLRLKGDDLGVNLVSQGSLTKKSTFALDVSLPYSAEMAGTWFWKNGPHLEQTTAVIDPLTYKISDSLNMDIKNASANILLAWPMLDANWSVMVGSSGIHGVNISSQLHIPNLLNWRKQTKLQLNSETALSAENSQVLNQILGTKNKECSQAIDICNNHNLVTSQLTLRLMDNDIDVKALVNKTDEISVESHLKAKLHGFTFSEIESQGNLFVASLQWPQGSKISSIQSKWTISNHEKVNKIEDWDIELHGQANALTYQDSILSDVNFDIHLAKKWQANISALSLMIQDQIFKTLSLNVKGIPENHHVSFQVESSQTSQLPLSLDFDAHLAKNSGKNATKNNIKNTQEYQWLIQNLKGSIPFADERYLMTAESLNIQSQQMQMEQFCLVRRNNNALCFDGGYSNGSWNIKAQFQQFNLNLFKLFLVKLAPSYIKPIHGIVNGKMTASGKLSEIDDLSVDLSIAELNFNALNWNALSDTHPLILESAIPLAVHWKDIRISSQRQKDAFQLSIGWSKQHVFLENLLWESEWLSPSGNLVMNIERNFNWNYHLNQPDILWKMKTQNPNSSSKKKIKEFIAKPIQKASLLMSGTKVANKIESKMSLLLPDHQHLKGQGSVNLPLDNDSLIQGGIAINLNQFQWLQWFQPMLDDVDLELQQTFVVTGSLAQPKVEGKGSITIKRLLIDQYGIDIQNSELNITGNEHNLQILGALKTGKGELVFSGNLDWSQQLFINVLLEGQKIILFDTENNRLVVSPDIKAKFQSNQLVVSGDILLEEGKISLAKLPNQAILVSSDQVIIGQEETNQKLIDYDIKINVVTGNSVSINGFGLESDLKGELKTILQSGKAPNIQGQLSLVNGKFEAYKQKLVIEQGQLLFLGPMDRPGIQFKSYRMVGDIKVGLMADGSLLAPRLTLYSEPAMPEENVLSLLVTGRNIDSLSQNDGNFVANAAIGLGVERANQLAQKVASTVGLKNILITSKANKDNTRVDVTTKLNDRISVSYGTSIDSKNRNIAGWIVEYQLTSTISFEVLTSEEVGASLNYKIQFNTVQEIEKDPSLMIKPSETSR